MENLCIALDDMAQHVQKNIENEKEKAALKHQLLEKENENLKKDELLALSELKMLQNQINPHFLFNTLNMIYKTAYRENATDTGAMVDKTAMLLRYALDLSLIHIYQVALDKHLKLKTLVIEDGYLRCNKESIKLLNMILLDFM